ncbi:MAG TPA: hypothetical protein VHE35_36205 [Kofleriaceae bacterium]|nr:hypothetical protein [Kofleriaceae bacterium]
MSPRIIRSSSALSSLLLATALAAGCGTNARQDNNAAPDGAVGTDGGPRQDGGPGGPDAGTIDALEIDAATAPVSPWTDVPPATVSLAGGAADTATGRAQPGGTLHLVTSGGITFDAGAQAPDAPVIPPPPADAMKPTSLPADLAAPGSLVIEGTVTTGGADAIRTISAVGDIYVAGTLRAADLGGARQLLRLNAGGNVYVMDGGTIDASGAGPGQAGGGVQLVGQRVIVVGNVTTTGGGGLGLGSGGGAITLQATHEVVVTGTVDSAGGDGHADGDAYGGAGATLTVQAGGDVVLDGTVRVRGGAAVGASAGAIGGAAGDVVIDSDSAAIVGGVVDARGGLARSSAIASVTGGAAGKLRVGETAPPTRIEVHAATDLRGGVGGALGGNGGSALLMPRAGDLRIDSRLDASGGDSPVQPGAGGTIEGHPGPDTATVTNAGTVIDGEVLARGGSALAGGNGAGGSGGLVKLVVVSTDGGTTVGTSGVVAVDGGHAAGSGRGGDGGLQYLFCRNGNASIAGHLTARGGDGSDTAGTGGTSGLVYVFTDDDHGGPGPGVLTIEADGVIDASGGNGSVGGSGRNDGMDAAVASWPVDQSDEYSVEQISVLINSDGVHGGATGWIVNDGLIIARGGHANGSGGDVFFHGTGPDRLGTPTPGRIDDAGDGTGRPGTFGGKHIIITGPTF